MRKSIPILIALATVVPAALQAQDDGSRAYLPGPKNVRVLGLFGVSIRGNQTPDPAIVVPGSKIKLDMAILEYAWTFDAGGKSSLGFLVLPYGTAKGTVVLPGPDVSKSSSGIGDFTFGASFGLVGPPLLSIPEFVAYKPTFTASALIKVSAPTGHYDSKSPINVGANRWTIGIGAPLTWYQGKSLVDPKLLTFELMPSVSFFTNNGSPMGGNSSSQDPLFRVEGHISQSLDPKTYVSLDGLYTFGGSTRLDGERTAGSMRALSLGGTVGYTVNPRTTLKLTYGQVVDRNRVSMEGNLWRLIATYSF